MRKQQGFTLIEILLVIAIVGILASIAFPSYREYVERANEATAAVDINSIEQSMERYLVMNRSFPDNLAVISTRLDPWGNPYQYMNLTSDDVISGQVRKDHALVPINSDYDLYSMGRDGASQAPLTAAASQDDIVRAGNGSYVGLASDF